MYVSRLHSLFAQSSTLGSRRKLPCYGTGTARANSTSSEPWSPPPTFRALHALAQASAIIQPEGLDRLFCESRRSANLRVALPVKPIRLPTASQGSPRERAIQRPELGERTCWRDISSLGSPPCADRRTCQRGALAGSFEFGREQVAKIEREHLRLVMSS